MVRFEYKLVKAPDRRVRYSNKKKGDDAFALTVMDKVNDIAQSGWEFIRKETMVENRRSLGVLRRRDVVDYLVFRRPRRADGLSLDTPVKPARPRVVSEMPNAEELRSRIQRVMAV